MHSKICHIKTNGSILTLICTGKVCSSEETVIEPWLHNSWWWGEYTDEYFSCKLMPRLVIAKGFNEHIFGTDCIPKDLACNLPKSIIVWDESIMMKCPFRPIVLRADTTIITKADNRQIFLMSNDTKWVMKSKNIVNACGYELIQTTEGLYISDSKLHFENIASAPIETTLLDDKSEIGVKLASDDYRERIV